MKYAKLEQLARNMDTLEASASLRSLANDNRFAAVVRLVLDHRESYVEAGSRQNMAASHGALAHCQGSVHATTQLLAIVKQICEPPVKRGAQKPTD